MKQVYVYVFNTLADWEPAYITALINSKEFYKQGAEEVNMKTVAKSKDSVVTKGGMTVVPDCTIEEMVLNESTALLLPGGYTWENREEHEAILLKAKQLFEMNGILAAICGATGALANEGLLNNRVHTSNAVEYLKMVAPTYTGEQLYKQDRAVADGNLVTASGAGALLWAKLIAEQLNIFSPKPLELWYLYHHTGDPKYIFELLQING